jgi:3-oxoacyl-[acyl-carrier protein] reductase
MASEPLVAVVTGSSSGIGRAIALTLANLGADLVIHGYRNIEGLAETAALIAQRGRQAFPLTADLADPAARNNFVQQAWNCCGKVDIWVNNAGVDVLTGAAASWSFEKKLAELWRVDVVASIELSRTVGARMKAQGSGTIINIGWDQAEQGMAGDSGELFAATKGAVMAFTRSLAASLAPQVRVNCVAPGWIKTKWGAGAPEEWQHRAVNEALLARWGTPEDVAGAVRFLASPDAAFLTAQTIYVNGGFKHGQYTQT